MSGQPGCQLQLQVDALALGGHPADAVDVRQALPQIERLPLDGQFTGLDLGQIENVVEDAQQGFARRPDVVNHVALIRRQRFPLQQLRHAEHAIHRRANFMAHVGQELGLGDIGGLGGIAGLLEFQFVALAGGDVHDRADQPDRATRLVLEHAPGIDPDDVAVTGPNDPVFMLQQVQALNSELVFPERSLALVRMHQQTPVLDRVIEGLIDAHNLVQHGRTNPASGFQVGHVVTQFRGGLGGLQQLHTLFQLSLYGLAFADVASDGTVILLPLELDVMGADLDRNQPPVPGTVLPLQTNDATSLQLGEMFQPVVFVTVAIQFNYRHVQQFILAIAQHAAGRYVAIEKAAIRSNPVDRLAGTFQGELTQAQ